MLAGTAGGRLLGLAVALSIAISAEAFVISPTLRIQPHAVAPCSKLRFRSAPRMAAASVSLVPSVDRAPKIVDRLKSVLVVFVVGFAMMLGAPAEADAASKGRSGGRAGGSSFRKPSQDHSRVGRTTPAATTPSSVASPSAASTTTAAAAGGAVGGATVVHHVHHSPSPWGFGGFGWHSPFGSPFGYGFGFRPMIILPSFFFFISIGFLLFWLFFSN